jgi:hypothetical protein
MSYFFYSSLWHEAGVIHILLRSWEFKRTGPSHVVWRETKPRSWLSACPQSHLSLLEVSRYPHHIGLLLLCRCSHLIHEGSWNLACSQLPGTRRMRVWNWLHSSHFPNKSPFSQPCNHTEVHSFIPQTLVELRNKAHSSLVTWGQRGGWCGCQEWVMSGSSPVSFLPQTGEQQGTLPEQGLLLCFYYSRASLHNATS